MMSRIRKLLATQPVQDIRRGLGWTLLLFLIAGILGWLMVVTGWTAVIVALLGNVLWFSYMLGNAIRNHRAAKANLARIEAERAKIG